MSCNYVYFCMTLPKIVSGCLTLLNHPSAVCGAAEDDRKMILVPCYSLGDTSYSLTLPTPIAAQSAIERRNAERHIWDENKILRGHKSMIDYHQRCGDSSSAQCAYAHFSSRVPMPGVYRHSMEHFGAPSLQQEFQMHSYACFDLESTPRSSASSYAIIKRYGK
jgi:hypothetical protein